MSCPEGKHYCFNPYYQNEICEGLDWCDKEILPEGFEYGEKPGILTEFAFPISITIMLFFLIINHLKYNKTKKNEIN